MVKVHIYSDDACLEIDMNKVWENNWWWFTFVIFYNIPQFCFTLHYSVFIRRHLDTRCVIPELENKWSYAEIQDIAQPKRENVFNNCSYLDLNYEKMAELSYEDALKLVKNSTQGVKILQCKSGITHEEFKTIYTEYDLQCEKTWSHLILIAPHFGQFLSGIFLTILGDFYGRKRVLKASLKVFFVAAVFLPFGNLMEVIFFRTILGASYQIIDTCIQASLIELRFEHHGHYLLFTYMGSSVAYFFINLFIRFKFTWRHLYWLTFAPNLLLPLVTYIVPESPAWFYANGEKKKALEVVKLIKKPIKLRLLLTSYKNQKLKLKEHKFMDFAKKFNFWYFVIILFNCSFLHIKMWLLTTDIHRQFEIHTAFFLMGSAIIEVPALMLAQSILYVLNRKRSLMLLHLLIGISLILIHSNTTHHWMKLVLLEITDLFSGVINLIAMVYVTENTPITRRCAAIGLSMALGRALPVIFFSTLSLYLKVTSLAFMGSCVSFLAFAFLVLAYLFVEDMHIDFFLHRF